jgi:hypothetical protein
MDRIELLTVEDSFQIIGRGLVVIPDFSVPNGWKDRTEKVLVVRPDGQQYEATAQFSMSHFKLLDPNASVDRRWRVALLLQDRNKKELPAGSKILVSQEIRDAILPHNSV